MQKYTGSCHCGAVRFEIETGIPVRQVLGAAMK
jgi:hypothetical protein